MTTWYLRKGELLLRNIDLPLEVGPHDVAKGSSSLTYFISTFVKRPLLQHRGLKNGDCSSFESIFSGRF